MNDWRLKPGDTICINKPGLFANKWGAEAPLGILSSGGLFGREGLDGPEVGCEVGEEQAAKTQCKGANRPEACAKVQRLSQISEYGVQSTEGTGWQGDMGAWGRRNRGAKGQGQRAQVNRAGWVHGYSWHAEPARRPTLPSNQTPIAHSSAAAVVITLKTEVSSGDPIVEVCVNS